MPDSIIFDRAAGYYDDTRGFPPGEENPISALIAQAGSLNSDSRVMEVGIGTGRIALPLAKHVRAVYGVDLSQRMMGRLREKQNSEAVYVALADAGRLPFPTNSFDAVLVVHVFHLVADLPAVLKELARVLRPDGRLIHCWNQDDGTFGDLRAIWNAEVVPTKGIWWGQGRNAALMEAGWQQLGDGYTHQYTSYNSPQNLLVSFQKRSWSSTWNISDEAMERGLATLKQAIDERYPDPAAPIKVSNSFVVTVFKPPTEG